MKNIHIRTGRARGCWNMALDRYLMELVRRGEYDFVLRTYGWEPACVSIGRLQDPFREIDVAALRNDGFHIVRRPTGGRQVWHETEVTYSVLARLDHEMVSGTVSEALRKVASPMVEAMRKLGLNVSVSSTDSHHVAGPRTGGNPCFTSHGRWEVGTGDGRKLVGSAQARSRGVFLEHGSILLENDQPKLLKYLPETFPESLTGKLRKHLDEGIACLREFRPDLGESELEEALSCSYSSAVGEVLADVPVSDIESQRLQELVEECDNDIP